MKKIWQKILQTYENWKYIVVVGYFLVSIIFVGNYTVTHVVKNNHIIHDLEEKIDRHKTDYQIFKEKIRVYRQDQDSLEHIAREKYMMKLPNEDIYQFEEDLKKR